jgi:hypothetical protein
VGAAGQAITAGQATSARQSTAEQAQVTVAQAEAAEWVACGSGSNLPFLSGLYSVLVYSYLPEL